MVTVEFLGPIGHAPIEVEASTLVEVSEILKSNELLAPWLEGCAVAVNDVLVTERNFALKEGDCISLLPPVCGG